MRWVIYLNRPLPDKSGQAVVIKNHSLEVTVLLEVYFTAFLKDGHLKNGLSSDGLPEH